MIISISGTPGTGKTSVGKLLAERLGYAFHSVGELRGAMAIERGITINELNKLGETDDSTDKPVDEKVRQMGIEKDNFVIEGRLAWLFIPHSFKILLTCDMQEASRRIFEARKIEEASRKDEPMYTSVEDTLHHIEDRVASDMLRYKKYYGVDYQDPSHYDLVLDTTNIQGVPAVTDVLEKAVSTQKAA